MTCEQFRESMIGDDPNERVQAERHAETCPACSEQLEADRELSREVAEWKAGSPAPPADLHRRIAEAIERSGASSGLRESSGVRSPAWTALAAAAVLMLAVAWLARNAPVERPADAAEGIEAILDQAERTRLEYARAIADLERSTAPLLARAGDPDLPAEQAALLLSYRDRLVHLDGVIAEVQGFLEQHPGHTGGNTILLAAYTEKQKVLGRLVRLRLGDRS